MKVRIKKLGKKDPTYVIHGDINNKNKGRLVELDLPWSQITQPILKQLYDAAPTPSREHKHDRAAEVAFIKELREQGHKWEYIADKMGRSSHAVQSLYRRHNNGSQR